MSLNKQFITIEHDGISVSGIIREAQGCDRIYVFIPSSTGTRIGPQRVFVELAQAFYNKGISSLCVDLPSRGESHKLIQECKFLSSRINTQRYHLYLDVVINFITKNYSLINITLISISDGCLPIYSYSKQKGIKQVILLSPDHIHSDIGRFYGKKKWAEEQVRGDQSINKVQEDTPVQHWNNYDPGIHIPNCLLIFGEKDKNLGIYLEYWRLIKKNCAVSKIEEYIIPGADHSFFGWKFKRAVEEIICKYADKNS